MVEKIAKLITFDHREYARLQKRSELLDQLDATLGTLQDVLRVLERDQALLVKALLMWPDFSAWLLTQDNSSSHQFGTHPDCKTQGKVEGRSDEELALAFAAHVTEKEQR